jgi:cytochrome b
MDDSSHKVLIWDLPVRLIHWLLVICFFGAYITAEIDELKIIHFTLGYTLAALIVIRIAWGFIGTTHAKFSNFIRHPKAAISYLRSMIRREHPTDVGHNPAGALAIVALLSLGLLVSLSGWSTLHEMVGEWAEEVHEVLANFMLVIVVVHIVAVVGGSFLQKENLVKAMITGKKTALDKDTIPESKSLLAIALLLAVLSFWFYQYDHAAEGGIDGMVALDQENEHSDE